MPTVAAQTIFSGVGVAAEKNTCQYIGRVITLFLTDCLGIYMIIIFHHHRS